MAGLTSAFLHQVAAAISSAVGELVMDVRATPVGGGDINVAHRLNSDDRVWFMKTNNAALLAMLEAEAAALDEIAATKTVRVPQPICSGTAEDRAYLVLEYLELHPLDGAAATRLGSRLAALHRHTAPQFGWHRENTIGATPQQNTWSTDWPAFWKTRRLGFQLQLAAKNGYGGKVQELGAKLLAGCDALFAGHTPEVSLLHGDLWGGNVGCDVHGKPVIFDPACYYGDREADLAMTSLFGGFHPAFLQSYQEAWPVDEGYKLRREFYNLYHLLNHLNLFGRGYLPQTEGLMQRLLAKLGG